MNKNNKIIPIIFAVDDNYAPYLSVTLTSLLENSSSEYFYKFYVLKSEISYINIKKLSVFNTKNSSIEFIDVADRLGKISGKLYLRDYYTNTTYFRFFIPAIFKEYDKVLYLDSDLVILKDISTFFNQDIGDNYVGAIQEEVMAKMDVFRRYVELGLDIPCESYFNAGILIMNLKKLREINVEYKFYELLNKFKFEVTQDQDYLNVICQHNSVLFDLGWNKTPIKNGSFNDKDLKIIHYKLSFKPWLYDNVMYQDYFWYYAEKTNYYSFIKNTRESYSPENKINDIFALKRLMRTAIDYTKSLNNYKRMKEGLEDVVAR